MVWHPFGNAKYCERVDVLLVEWEEEKMKGLESGSACFHVGCLDREIRELL